MQWPLSSLRSPRPASRDSRSIKYKRRRDGEDFSVEPSESRRPFRALLDVGLIRTTTGNCVFGAQKGTLDGGLDIPHSEKRFAGFSRT